LAAIIQSEGRKSKAAQDAVGKIMLAHQGLVWQFARTISHPSLAMDDVVQEGFVGLALAAWRFDPAKYDTRFTTYAGFWIRETILRSITEQGFLIRVPHYLVQKMIQVRRLREKRALQLGKSPSFDELADEMQIDDSQRRHIRTAMASRKFLFDGDDKQPYLESRPVERSGRVYQDEVAGESELAMMADAIETLDPLDQYAIRCIYGVGCDAINRRTLARKLKIRYNELLGIEETALAKMRSIARRQNWRAS